MRYVAMAFILVALTGHAAQAQLVVNDPAVTLQNTITAVLKEYILQVQQEQHSKLRRMATRLSMHTPLGKYALPDPPRWRTHDWDMLYAQAYNQALIFGDPDGTAYRGITHALVPHTLPLHLSTAARRALAARLATIDAADAVAISATHDTGQLRFNGRKRELPAIDALEAHVIDPSNEQSATAVADKMSGAVLIGARQRQARAQLLAAMLEQLLVESKRTRDAETEALNRQIVTWRTSDAANRAFVAGSEHALRTWRQP